MTITSAKNPLLQTIRHAAASGRPTEDRGLVVIEGPHLLEEAQRGAWRVEQILVTPEARHRYTELLSDSHCEIAEVSARTFASTAATENSQQVLALVRPPVWRWDDLARGSALIVVLDGIQDPGNAGTIMRSAEAFGATGIVFLKGSVHVANGKFLRATSGSIFRLPFLEAMAPDECIASLHASNLTFYALSSPGDIRLGQADFRRPCALAVGSEGSGLSHHFASEAQKVEIPAAKVESLNAAIACSIALYTAQQQRSDQ